MNRTKMYPGLQEIGILTYPVSFDETPPPHGRFTVYRVFTERRPAPIVEW